MDICCLGEKLQVAKVVCRKDFQRFPSVIIEMSIFFRIRDVKRIFRRI